MKLYHFIPNEHLEFVKKTRKLFSAAEMLDACKKKKPKRQKREHCITLPSGKTKDGTVLPKGIILRDQGKLEEANLAFCPEFRMGDLVEELNKHVFFWPCFPEKFAKKYQHNALIRCCLEDVKKHNHDKQPLYCPFNSGAPKRDGDGNKVLRSRCMYQPLNVQCVPAKDIVEVVFQGCVKLPKSCDYMTPDEWQKEYLQQCCCCCCCR